jgi:hypothetical protein
MKLLNLIPDEEKKRLKIKKFKIGIYIGLFIFLITFLYMEYSTSVVQKEIEAANTNILEVNSLDSNIKSSSKEVENLSNTLGNLKEESIPLNFFLLFLGDNIPEDIKVHSLLSEPLILSRKEQGLTSDGELIDRNESEKSSVIVVDNSSVEEEDKKINTNVDNSQNITNTEDKNNPNNETIQKNSVEIEVDGDNFEVELDNKNLIIRGSALSVKSIGDFIYALEGTDYIETVDTKYIRNYYNGIDNYKLFELKVIVKVEGTEK